MLENKIAVSLGEQYARIADSQISNTGKHINMVAVLLDSYVKYETVVFSKDDRRFKMDKVLEFFKTNFECIECYTHDYISNLADDKVERTHRSLYFDDVTQVYTSVSLVPVGSKGSYQLSLAFISLDEEAVKTTKKRILDVMFDLAVKVKFSDKGYMSMIIQTQGGFTISKYAINPIEVDLEGHYGNDFVEKHHKIVESLKNGNKGIVLLHGTPGTGKTSYLRYLINELKDLNIIFLPPHMCDSLSSPGFLPFLATQANSVLVIEDAERAIMSRERGQASSQAVSNLLNISDGLMSDFLNIKVIATFNTSRGSIDEALLRKGRLIAEHEFGALSVKDSQALVDKLGFEHTVNEKLTLAEIYNLKENNYAKAKKSRPVIGFGTKE